MNGRMPLTLGVIFTIVGQLNGEHQIAWTGLIMACIGWESFKIQQAIRSK